MRWIEPDVNMATEIGLNLREQDRIEVQLSHGIGGLHAVLGSYRQSRVCMAIEGDDGTPVGMTGVAGDRIWLLGTEGLTATKSHRWQLCLHGREWVEHCLEVVGCPIGNHVYAKNRQAIRWLKHLGFTVEHPEPIGPSLSLFCPFWRAR